MTEAEQQLRAHPSATASAQDWQDRLTLIEATWGDGWVLRQALAGVPRGIDLGSMASTLSSAHSSLKAVLNLEAEARQHRGDSDWWRGALQATRTDLERRHWVFSLVTAAQASVVVDLQAELNTLVDGLSPKHYAVLRAAVQAQSKLSTGRVLVVADPLRLKQVRLSDRLLWLIRVLASEGSVEQIHKKLSTKIAPLLRPGSGDMRELVRVVSPKKIGLNEFRGARATLPVGGWASGVKFGVVSRDTAEEILSEPDQWPGDVVQHAVEGIEERMAKGLVPLATIADANRWFD